MRYPQDLFDIQSEQYLAYHMTDTRVFYNKEDLWAIPLEIFDGTEQPMEPYYVYLRLREEEEPEYLLIQPFTPSGKQNMIAWMAARNDPDHYGELIVYELPKQELVFGPLQVEGRIDQEPEISQQFSLWDQRGSRVIRGNLLVIPIQRQLCLRRADLPALRHQRPAGIETRHRRQRHAHRHARDAGRSAARPAAA